MNLIDIVLLCYLLMVLCSVSCTEILKCGYCDKKYFIKMDRFLLKTIEKSNSLDKQKVEVASKTSTVSQLSFVNNDSNLGSGDFIKNMEDSQLFEDSEISEETNQNQQLQKSSSKNIKKRKNFCINWLTEFKWAREFNGKTRCTVCGSDVTGSAFHLRRHAKSSIHIKNAKSISNTSDVKQSMSTKNTLKDNVKNSEYKLCIFLCNQNLPFLLMDTLPEVCSNSFPDSEIARYLKVGRTKCKKIILSQISPYAKYKLIEKLRSCFFSIILDETSDISMKKCLVLLVKFWDEEKGVLDRFYDLIEIPNGTAETIFEEVKKFLDNNQIPYENLIGFGADNAVVNMGDYEGIKARLKKICPNLMVQGCVSHSAHLCASYACEKLPNSIEQFARDIYNYFKNSPKRRIELEDCQIFVEETPHKMLRVSQTRWLSLRAVVNRILQHWSSLKMFFENAVKEENLPSAKNVLSALNNTIYKEYLYFLSYALELVTTLNLEFQSEKPKIAVLLERVSSLFKQILRNFIKKDLIGNNEINLSKFQFENPRNFKFLYDMYFGAKLDAFIKSGVEIDQKDMNYFRLRALDFYIELCKQIKDRFNFGDPVLKYASKFSIKNALSGDIISIAEYVNLFPNIKADVKLVNLEWQNLSTMLSLEDFKNCETIDFWYKVDKIVNESGVRMFSNLMQVVKYIMSLPHSSAAAERSFSQLNLIKSKIRNRLHVVTCASLLRVKDAVRVGIFNYKNISAKEISAYLSEKRNEEDPEIQEILEILKEDINLNEIHLHSVDSI